MQGGGRDERLLTGQFEGAVTVRVVPRRRVDSRSRGPLEKLVTFLEYLSSYTICSTFSKRRIFHWIRRQQVLSASPMMHFVDQV